jgi:Fe-Mn family superoxide dismutase
MAYTAKDYARLLGMAGFSEALLKNHFTLYQGYVTNTNKVLDTLKQMLGIRKAACRYWSWMSLNMPSCSITA